MIRGRVWVAVMAVIPIITVTTVIAVTPGSQYFRRFTHTYTLAYIHICTCVYTGDMHLCIHRGLCRSLRTQYAPRVLPLLLDYQGSFASIVGLFCLNSRV